MAYSLAPPQTYRLEQYIMGRMLLAAVLAIYLLASPHAYADSIYNVQVLANLSLGPGPNSTSSGNIYGSGNSTVQVSATPPAIPNGTYPDIAASGANAIAGPNHLGVEAGANATANGVVHLVAPYVGTSELSIASASVAIAQFNDTLQLSNAPTTGILDVYVQLDGSIYVDSLNNGFPQAYVNLVGNTDFTSGRPASGTCVILRTETTPTPGCGLLTEGTNLLELPYVLQANNTIPFGLSMTASSFCQAVWEGNPQVPSTCLTDVLFLDTAQVSSIVVADSNGNPVIGAYATSLNGVDYSLPPDPTGVTPEPSTLAMLGTGIVGLAAAARRRLTV